MSEIVKRKGLADYYYDNYKKYRDLKKYNKASEFLWGALNNLVYALGVVYGEKVSSHKKVKEFINNLSAICNKPELAKLFAESAEVLHANFYHDFLDEDSFKVHEENMEKLLEMLSKILSEELEKRGTSLDI